MHVHLEALSRVLTLEGTLTAKTALHVGSRRSLGSMESDNPVIKDHRGRPLIPGSSLKGVLRSAIEAALRGLGVSWVCSPSDGQYCIDKEQGDKKQWSDTQYVLQCACPVCRLFGAPYLASRIRIEDLEVSDDWNESLYSLRDGVAIDRDTRTAAHGKKFDFETVPAGTAFSFRIAITNPRDYEIGMLALALDLLNQGFIFIGGNTSRGLGRVSLKISGIRETSATSIQNYFQNGGELYQSKDWNELRTQGLRALKDKIEEWKNQGQECEHV